MEATSSTKKYKKKYKCPYCEVRLERPKLVQHVQNKHADLIPEGYTALRVVFNYINKKECGHCIICGKETPWNEEKGRYERLCNSDECRKAYEKMTRERTKKKYGTDNMQGDPRYAAEIQKKALANRRISGEYQFSDGGKVMYVGSYEKKFLEFMDIVMKINSEDIISPGPEMEYMLKGKKHLYLPDFYYIPYNLLIEIKDGQDNRNENQEMMKDNIPKQKAKEKAVIDSGKFNYVKITNNDFSQLISIFAAIKYQLIDDYYDPVIQINESSMIPSTIVTESDIDIVKELFNRDDVESIEDISESELQAFYKVAGLDESGTLNELSIVEANDSGNFMTDPLYVVLMDLNMIRNKVIKAYTHSQWSHSAISFDSSLDEMYSYANERDENNKVLRTGFTRENKRSYLKINPKCKTKLFALFITPVQMENVKKLVNYYLNNISKTAYNMFSIIGIVVHKVLKRAINDPLKMICSQFVYTILLAAQITSTITKNTALVTPEDINSKLLDDRLFTIYDGLLKDYNQKEVDRLTKKAYKALMKKNIHENTEYPIEEGYIFNDKDIYYNKDKFDSGEINLCFITGLSGSGKSTMGRGMKDAEHYELDDVVYNKIHFSMENLKEYGDLIYSFFTGPGKKYYYTPDDVKNGLVKNPIEGDYDEQIINDFINYSISYSKSHKGKYVLDGIWLYIYISPEKLKDYAVYIKGTSALISNIRAAKRDSQEEKTKIGYAKHFMKRITDPFSFIQEKDVKKYRDYFGKLMKKNMREATIEEQQTIMNHIDKISKPTGYNFWDFLNEMNESMSGAIGAALPLTPEPRPYESNEDNYYIVQHLQNNVYDYSITKDPTQYTMYSLDPEKGYRVYKSENIDKNYITFKMKDSKKAKEVYKEIYDSFGKSIENATPDYIYYKYTGNHILTEDQLLYDERLELVPNFKDQIQEMCNSFYREFCPDDMDRLEKQMEDLEREICHG